MTGRQRILDRVRGRATDCLPCMPITMMFASDLFGSRYLDYATDYRVQSAGQLKIAEEFELDHVSVISDPCCEASDCGTEIIFYENEPPAPDGENALLRDKATLDTRAILPSLAKLGCEIVDVDAMVPMDIARQAVGGEQVLLGNLDPVRAILNGAPETIRAGFAQCHQEAGSHYIVGAGCEIPRGTPLENFRAIVDYARAAPGGGA